MLGSEVCEDVRKVAQETEMSQPQALVLWSGGCDSTLLLFDLLREKKRVRTLSVCHPNVMASEQSLRARKKLRKKLLRDYSFDHVELVHQPQAIDGKPPAFFCEGCEGLPQPGIWLASALPYLHREEDLYLGYIKGDCIWHYKQELLSAFASLQALAGRTGKLLFPFEWLSKADVIDCLKKNNLYKHVWYCENPQVSGQACGRCDPCLTHKTALYRLEIAR